MKLIPSIDIYDGMPVRLEQGAFDKMTRYDVLPTTLAERYQQQGAEQLHIVDLKGAQSGQQIPLQSLLAIKQAADLKLQIGGGLRSLQRIELLLEHGIDSVVIGSLAVTAIPTVKTLIDTHGVDKVILALDVQFVDNIPMIAIHGWQQQTQISVFDLLSQYAVYKGLQILCTDISKDGLLKGPNIQLYTQLIKTFEQFKYQASGGIATLADLKALQAIDMSAAIVGKALYENSFSVSEAIEALSYVN